MFAFHRNHTTLPRNVEPAASSDVAQRAKSPHRLPVLAVAWLLACSLNSSAIGHPSLDPEGIADGQWPVYRHDSRLTGQVYGRGDIAQPKVVWRVPLGLRATKLVTVIEPARITGYDIDRDGHADSFAVSERTLTVTGGGPDRAVYTFTIPDDQRDLFNAACVKVANFLPEVPGLEIAAWTSNMETGTGRGRLFAFDDGIGEGRVVWTTEPMEKTCYAPEMVAADVDNDGRVDIALAPHYQVFVFDAETGDVISNVKWPIGRNYGLFAAVNADDDPQLELFVLNDFTLHLSMIDFDAGGGRLGWFQNFKRDLEEAGQRPLSFRLRPDALSDVNDDGYVDLVLNRFDARRDARWHIVVLSTDTGEVLTDLPDHQMAAVTDLDGDGVNEVLCQNVRRQAVRGFCTVRVFNLDTARPELRGEIPRAKLLWRAARFGPTVSSIANDGQRTPVITRRRPGQPAQVWVLLDEDRDNRPDAMATYELRDGEMAESWRFSQPGGHLDVRGIDLSRRGKITVEVVNLHSGQRWTGQQGQPLTEEGNAGNSEPGWNSVPLIVDLDGDGRNEIVVEDALERIRVLSVPPPRTTTRSGNIKGDRKKDAPPPSVREPVLLWDHAGHGMNMTPGYVGRRLSAQAADLDRDGKTELIVGGVNRDDEPTLRVLTHDGSVRWEWSAQGMTASGVDAGMDIWFLGQFTGDATLDVYCSFHTLEKGSSRAVVLDGRTGRVVWKQKTVEVEKTKERFAFGVYGGSVLDVNGDRYDDLILTHYSALGIHDGRTGKTLRPVRKWAHDYFPKWVSYSWPTALRLFANDEPVIYANTATATAGAVGAITLSGQRRMFHPLTTESGPTGFQALGDADDDGYVEIGYGHQDGRFACYNLNTGKKRWEHTIPPGGTSDVILADVDGDERREFVFCDAAGNLVAMNVADKPAGGRVRWSMVVKKGKTGIAGHPIAGDVDGDGTLEILLVSSFTGELLCIDNDPAATQPASQPTTKPTPKSTGQPTNKPANDTSLPLHTTR